MSRAENKDFVLHEGVVTMKTERVRWGSIILGAFLAVILAVAPALAAPVRVGPGAFATPGENPVNIGLRQPTFRITFMPGDIELSNNAWAVSELDRYLDTYLTDEMKKELVQDIPEDGLDLNLLTWSSVGLGVAGFSTDASIRVVADGHMAKDLIDLALNGNELNRYYDLDGTKFGGAAFGDVSVGLAFNLGPSVRVGGRYHRLMGIAYLDAAANGGGILNYTDTDVGFTGDMVLDADYIWGPGLHGDGAAYDLGLALQPTENLAFSFAVMDIGQITWHNVRSERFEGKLDSETGPELEIVEEQVLPALKWALPRRFEVGMGYRLTPSLHFGGTYTRTVHMTNQGFTYEQPDQIRAMLSWDGLGILPLGVGVSYVPGEDVAFTGEAGLRLGPVRTKLRLHNIEAAFGGGEGKDFGLAVDVGIVF